MPSQVGYQGLPGAYSHGAASELVTSAPGYDKGSELVAFDTFFSLFDSLERKEIEYAIVPLESSISGAVHVVYELLLRRNTLQIIGEFLYHERHCLIALPNTELSSIKIVKSHPHVLDQCREYIRKNLSSDVQVTQAEDTAGCARDIAANQQQGVAAIAGARAAAMYKLNVLATGIEDNSEVATRYGVISLTSTVPLSAASKTTISFSTRNKPAALFKALSCFALRDINIARIESRPTSRATPATGRPWEYSMLIDVEGATTEDRVKRAIDNLQEFSTEVRVLGSFPRYGVLNLPESQGRLYGIGG